MGEARHGPLASCEALAGEPVVNLAGQRLGTLAHIAIEAATGRIAYAVLAHGGVFGIGEKLFAVPWDALRRDAQHGGFTLDLPRECLAESAGFDRDHWPANAEPEWRRLVQRSGNMPLRKAPTAMR